MKKLQYAFGTIDCRRTKRGYGPVLFVWPVRLAIMRGIRFDIYTTRVVVDKISWFTLAAGWLSARHLIK